MSERENMQKMKGINMELYFTRKKEMCSYHRDESSNKQSIIIVVAESLFQIHTYTLIFSCYLFAGSFIRKSAKKH